MTIRRTTAAIVFTAATATVVSLQPATAAPAAPTPSPSPFYGAVTAVTAVIVARATTAASPARADHGRTRAGARDRSLIVWTHTPSLDEVDRTGNLLISHPDGRGQRQLTAERDGVNDIDAVISPEGRRVAFQRLRENSSHLRLVPVSGGRAKKLDLGCTGECWGDVAPTWLAPDRLSFTRYFESDKYPEGWASKLYTVRMSGSTAGKVRPWGHKNKLGVWDDSYARLSPDGRFVVFSRLRISDSAIAVFRMRPDGRRLRQLTPFALDAQLPHLSPATSGPTAGLIVFQTYGKGHPDGSARDLATVPASCASLTACLEAVRYVTKNSGGTGRASNPAWSPDGRRIAFAGRPSADDVDCQIATIRWNGKHRRVVSTSPLFDFRPDWGSARSARGGSGH